MSRAVGGARFDWYQATIRRDAPSVYADLLAFFEGAWLEEAPIRLGYGEAFAVRDREGKRATVQSGGRNRWPNVTGSGEDAPGVAAFLREVYPEHEVTRLDSCVDTNGSGDGSWEVVRDLLLDVADDRRQGTPLRVSMAGDWREGRGEQGRTLYLGAPSSAVRLRAYEKGKQLRSMVLPGADLVPLDAVRIEVQVRPVGSARRRAATVGPEDAWSFADFTRTAALRLFGRDLERIHVRDHRESDDARALAFLVKQYGAVLEREARHRGSLAAVWEHLENLLGTTAAPGGAGV